MPPPAVNKRMSVIKALKILYPITAALFCLTMILAFQMNTQIRQVLMTGASCSCTDGNANSMDSTRACGSTCKPVASSNLRQNERIKLPSVCWNDSCRSDYVRLLQKGDAHPIPEIRHILWRNESVSEYFAQQLATWQKIHPDWTFVLWRDQDMEPFVAAYFPGMLEKFRSLPDQIMRVDMIRYMILYKYGGTYADLDYSLTASLDKFRRFHAVVTREPEAHSLQALGLAWPVKPFVSPAFLMSAPGHAFFHYTLQQLKSRWFLPGNPLVFAGPFGLSKILESYAALFPVGNHGLETVLLEVFVPPSFSFYPYRDNRLNSSGSAYVGQRLEMLAKRCSLMMSSDATDQMRQRHQQLVQYCTDVNNMDPITDRSQPVIAVHDLQKSGSAYDGVGARHYTHRPRDMRTVVIGLKLGRDFM